MSTTFEQFKRIGAIYSPEAMMGRPMAHVPPPSTPAERWVAELDALGAEANTIFAGQLALGHLSADLAAASHAATMRMMLRQPATADDAALDRIRAAIADLARRAADAIDAWQHGLRERLTADVIRDRKVR